MKPDHCAPVPPSFSTEPECTGTLNNFAARCCCGCEKFDIGVHVVRTLAPGEPGEMVSMAKIYAAEHCPICPREAPHANP